jgi:prolyl oligopeptidase
MYGTATAGSDWNEFHIREVASGKDQPEVLTRIKFSDAVWTHDNAGFFYSRYPALDKAATTDNQAVFDELANQKVYYHRVGTPQSDDVLVFELTAQPKWFVGAELTPDGRYLFLSLRPGSGDQCRIYYIDLKNADAPQLGGDVVKLVDNFDDAWQLVGSHGRDVFFRTNLGAPKNRIVAIDLDKPDVAQARTVVPESQDTLLTSVQAGGRLVVLDLHDAASRLTSWSYEGKRLGTVRLPGLGAIPEDALHGSIDDDELQIGYQSFNQPLTPYRVSVSRSTSQVFRTVQLAFDPSLYVTEQVFYPSLDGTRVPMFISYRKGLKRDGRAQAFLHGYGGFNIPKTPAFDASALAWMEKGGVYAVACLRGGGEYGEPWHAAGTRERKQNVFDDFAAAGRYLVDQRWTEYPRIAIWGRSNGGLLVGASVNQRPQLWGAAVATVGVMDMLRFHKFTVGYAWTGDYGSSDDAEGFAYLRRYSPVHTTVKGMHYPPTLVTTGDHDDRVHPAHSYKYTAALQAAQGGDAPILIRIDTRAGHGAGKPVAKIIDEEADKLAFMWHYTAPAAAEAVHP